MKFYATIVTALIAGSPTLAGKVLPRWGDIDQWDCKTDGEVLDKESFSFMSTFTNTGLKPCRISGAESISTAQPYCDIALQNGQGFCFNLQGGLQPPTDDSLRSVLQNFRLACNGEFHDGMSAYMWNAAAQHNGMVYAFKNVSAQGACAYPKFSGFASNTPDVNRMQNNDSWYIMDGGWKWKAFTGDLQYADTSP